MIPAISFGRITKVNGSTETAEKIVSLSEKSNKKGNELKKVLYNGKSGKAAVCSPYDDKNVSWIFTGKDYKKFKKSSDMAYDVMDWAFNHYKNGDIADTESDAAWYDHNERVRNIIESHKGKIPVINVTYDIDDRYYDGECERHIESIDIIA